MERAVLAAGGTVERASCRRYSGSWLKIGWMTVEAIVAIVAVFAAGSLILVAFGLDGVIELASAGVLVWRLSVELQRGEKFSESAEVFGEVNHCLKVQ